MSMAPVGQLLCQQCQQRPGTHTWVADGGIWAYTHGGGQWWCEECVVRAQLAHAEKVTADIPALKDRLLELTTRSR